MKIIRLIAVFSLAKALDDNLDWIESGEIPGTEGNFTDTIENKKNFTVPEDDGYCRALALRGGGTNGAYEIGIFKKMI